MHHRNTDMTNAKDVLQTSNQKNNDSNPHNIDSNSCNLNSSDLNYTECANKPSALLQLINVCYNIEKKPLVTNIDLTIFPNDLLSLIGPNGAGKSTLVKLILGLLTPSSGMINKAEGIVIGYVPQKFSIPTILPLRVLDLLNQVRKGRLSPDEKKQLLTVLSIKPLMDKQMIHLSGGETQRVLLARALLEKPELLILDEPMQGLDSENEELLYHFIDNLPDFLRCAMLVVSHDLHWVMKGSRHVICLNKHICCEGQPVEIQDMLEFQKLFGTQFDGVRSMLEKHKYEQPYIHRHEHCQHLEEISDKALNQTKDNQC